MTLSRTPSFYDKYEQTDALETVDWRKKNSQLTEEKYMTDDFFHQMKNEAVKAQLEPNRIPALIRSGKMFYNVWIDNSNKRGILRETTLESYKTSEPQWVTFFDLDQANKDNNKQWSWSNSSPLDLGDENEAIIYLNDAKSDKMEIKRIDVKTGKFIHPEMDIPLSKSTESWIDKDTTLIADASAPEYRTKSGYARVVKVRDKSQNINQAKVIFEAEEKDVSVFAYVNKYIKDKEIVIEHYINFDNPEIYLYKNNNLEKINLPLGSRNYRISDAFFSLLKSDFVDNEKTISRGTLISNNMENVKNGNGDWKVVYTPKENESIDDFQYINGFVLLNLCRDVCSVIIEASLDENEDWKAREISIQDNSKISIRNIEGWSVKDNKYKWECLLIVHTWISPAKVMIYELGSNNPITIKETPNSSELDGIRVEQRFAKYHIKDESGNDTDKVIRAPYTIKWGKGAVADGNNATIVKGYGGFQSSIKPQNDVIENELWLKKGNVVVETNLPGGGEYEHLWERENSSGVYERGGDWHKDAKGKGRTLCLGVLEAVARDLIKEGVTNRRQIGFKGYSNGGLLAALAATARESVFEAVHAANALLDMKNYRRIARGDSWFSEFGDDTPSPFHQCRPGMPHMLFTGSAGDTLTGIAHPTKMAMRCQDEGNNDVSFWAAEAEQEVTHDGAVDLELRAKMAALSYNFFFKNLGGKRGV